MVNSLCCSMTHDGVYYYLKHNDPNNRTPQVLMQKPVEQHHIPPAAEVLTSTSSCQCLTVSKTPRLPAPLLLFCVGVLATPAACTCKPPPAAAADVERPVPRPEGAACPDKPLLEAAGGCCLLGSLQLRGVPCKLSGAAADGAALGLAGIAADPNVELPLGVAAEGERGPATAQQYMQESIEQLLMINTSQHTAIRALEDTLTTVCGAANDSLGASAPTNAR